MLKQRVITALILAPLGVLAIFYLNAPAFAILLAAVHGGAAYEWGRLVRVQSKFRRRVIGLLTALALATGYLALPPDAYPLLAAVALVWLVLALVWFERVQWGADLSRLTRSAKTLLGALVIGASYFALCGLFDQPSGRILVVSLLVLVWAVDVGAFTFGKLFGKRKLAPQISPGKTWAGFWGGIALALLVGLAIALVFGEGRAQQVALISLAGLAATASVAGDLLVSLLKRHVGLKDSGRSVPGHGGFLDRFDSLMAASPIFYLGVVLIGL